MKGRKKGGKSRKVMKKILIDLDVVTVHLWDKSSQAEEAGRLIEKLGSKSFEVIVPYTLIELAERWQYVALREKVIGFYKENAKTISVEEVREKLENFGVNDKEIIISLIANCVKEEDAALVIVASLFKVDYLVTFNRKHLRNREQKICDVLSDFNLPRVKIRTPQELLEEQSEEGST